MIAGIHLGLDLDHLAVAGHAVRIHLDERIALAKDLDEGINLLRLEGAVKRNFAFGLGLLNQGFLALIRRQLVKPRQYRTGGFRGCANDLAGRAYN